MAAAQMHAEGRLVRDPIAQKAWESSLTEVQPSTPEGRMYRQAPIEEHDVDKAFKDLTKMVSGMAPKGIKPETMRKSENVIDVRQPAEDPFGTDSGNRAMVAYLRGNISKRDFDELYPEAGPPRRGDLARLAGIEDVDKLTKLLTSPPEGEIGKRFPGYKDIKFDYPGDLAMGLIRKARRLRAEPERRGPR
jgi:hypothetical protein